MRDGGESNPSPFAQVWGPAGPAPKRRASSPTGCRTEVDLKIRGSLRAVPLKSKSQRRFLRAAEERGDVPEGTAQHFEAETPKGKKLPEKKRKNRLKDWAEKGSR